MPTLKEIYDPRHSRELIKTIDKKFYGNFAISEADEYTDPELERAQSKGVELIEKIVKTNDRAYVSTRGSFLKSNRSSFREIIDNEPTKAPGTPCHTISKNATKRKKNQRPLIQTHPSLRPLIQMHPQPRPLSQLSQLQKFLQMSEIRPNSVLKKVIIQQSLMYQANGACEGNSKEMATLLYGNLISQIKNMLIF